MLDVNDARAPVSVLIPPEPVRSEDLEPRRPVHETAAFWAVVGLAALDDAVAARPQRVRQPVLAAVARSGSASWHAFWYGSFSPAGFITLDKAPARVLASALTVRFARYGDVVAAGPPSDLLHRDRGRVTHLVRRRFGWWQERSRA